MAEAAPAQTPRLSRAARRTQLLTAARAAFVDQGYHAAAMDDIAERAGVSKPVLYQHFPSKLELYLALLGESAAEMVRLVREALRASSDNHERVDNAVAAYFSFVADNDQAYRLIFESDVLSDPLIAHRIEQFNSSLASSIARVVVEDTDMSEDEGLLIGRGLAGLSQISARYWATSDSAVDQNSAVELISRLAWRGISQFPKEN